MEIETDRLLLRQFRQSDIDDYADMVADEECMRFVGGVGGRGETWRRMAKWAGQWILRGYGEFAVEEKSTGRFIGHVGPWHPEDWPQVELGWTLARGTWGKGYAPEAARACARWMFDDLDFPRIISIIHPDNAASIRVAEKLGQSRDGTFSHNGEDVLIYAMTSETFIED